MPQAPPGSTLLPFPAFGVLAGQLVGRWGELTGNPVFSLFKNRETERQRTKDKTPDKDSMSSSGSGVLKRKRSELLGWLTRGSPTPRTPDLKPLSFRLSGSPETRKAVRWGGSAGILFFTLCLCSSVVEKSSIWDCIESLIEREAITVETFRSNNGNTGKQYILNPDLLNNWQN